MPLSPAGMQCQSATLSMRFTPVCAFRFIVASTRSCEAKGSAGLIARQSIIGLFAVLYCIVHFSFLCWCFDTQRAKRQQCTPIVHDHKKLRTVQTLNMLICFLSPQHFLQKRRQILGKVLFELILNKIEPGMEIAGVRNILCKALACASDNPLKHSASLWF